jgi:hypothetical protein
VNLGSGRRSGHARLSWIDEGHELAGGRDVVVPHVGEANSSRECNRLGLHGIPERKARLHLHAHDGKSASRGGVEQVLSIRAPERVIVKVPPGDLISRACRRERLNKHTTGCTRATFRSGVRDPPAVRRERGGDWLP